MWNQLMAQFKCCGVNSYSDFEQSQLWLQNKSSRQIPEACCVLADKTLLTPQDLNCPYSPSDINSYYMKVCRIFKRFSEFQMFLKFFLNFKGYKNFIHIFCQFFFHFFPLQGCNQAIMDYLAINCNIIIGAVSGLILIQLMVAFLAFCICKCIGSYRASSRL